MFILSLKHLICHFSNCNNDTYNPRSWTTYDSCYPAQSQARRCNERKSGYKRSPLTNALMQLANRATNPTTFETPKSTCNSLFLHANVLNTTWVIGIRFLGGWGQDLAKGCERVTGIICSGVPACMFTLRMWQLTLKQLRPSLLPTQ